MGTEAILLVTPPPISEPNRLAWILETYGVELPAPERTNETAGQYAAACSALAQDLNVPVVNLWEAFQKVDDWADELLCDGLHLTAKGNAVVGEMVLQQVETSFPELAPDVMKWDVPEWTLLAEAEDAGQEVTAHLAKAEKA